MNRSEDKDPTCVIRMLDEYRSTSASSRRTLMGGRPIFPFCQINPLTSTKPTKLVFDDSLSQSNIENGAAKRLRLEDESVDSSVDSSKVSESSVMASPWEARRLKAELMEARAQIASLETRFNEIHALKKQTELVYEQEKNALQQTIERDRNKVDELEQRLKTIRKREAEVRKEFNEFRNAQKEDRYSSNEKCEKLQLDNAELQNRLAEVEAASREKCEAIERQLMKVTTEASNTAAELADTRRLCEELTAELRERRKELRLWDTDKAKLAVAAQRIKELEYEKESNLEAYNLAQAQQAKLIRITELEREICQLKEENKNLKQATSNIVYLEGLVEDMRAKLTQMDEQERECISLRVELGVAQGRLNEWSALTQAILGHSPTQGPVAVRRCIEALQQRELALSQEKAHADTLLKSLKETHKETLKELQDCKNEVSNTKKSMETYISKIRRLRKQITLITWERDDLRNLVDSCQKEVTMTATSLEAPANSRLEALEKLVQGYQQRMEQLESDPSLAVTDNEGAGKAASDKIEKLGAEKTALLKENQELQKHVEELKIQMEYRALKGDFDMRDCKILHFRMNPVAEAGQRRESELERGQAEVARLRERIRLLEAGQTHDLTQAVAEGVSANVSKELEDLREKLKSSERQNQRLKEVFKTTSHEFREAVYQLLGYKVDGLPNKIYRLSNLYAEAPDDHLLFKMSGTGGMELLETPFSASCSDLIDLHLMQHHSIPMFLSALTSFLFQRQTMTSH